MKLNFEFDGSEPPALREQDLREILEKTTADQKSPDADPGFGPDPHLSGPDGPVSVPPFPARGSGVPGFPRCLPPEQRHRGSPLYPKNDECHSLLI
jgi:hypothetical protein